MLLSEWEIEVQFVEIHLTKRIDSEFDTTACCLKIMCRRENVVSLTQQQLVGGSGAVCFPAFLPTRFRNLFWKRDSRLRPHLCTLQSTRAAAEQGIRHPADSRGGGVEARVVQRIQKLCPWTWKLVSKSRKERRTFFNI